MTPLNDDLRGRSAHERREERDLLGFLRQPGVRWLTPGLLVRAGVEVAVSSAFGKLADKRELQRDPQGPFDDWGEGELWLDYLSDTGDGWEATYTMAWLLAQPELTVDGQRLPRGRVLLLGGDQVYPAASPETYEDRFQGPFASALPWSPPAEAPQMFATPGNHDWYDGLTSFLRLFCGERWIGGWKTRQKRSYFALQLPQRWWIWAIDIQLDTYLDGLQLDYFRAQDVQEGDKVILLTAKPSWVKAYDDRVEPSSWRYLAFFEEHEIRARGGRLRLTLTGDLHHYSRYEPSGAAETDSPTRITAGGGGAYLSPTHTLREKVRLKPWLDREPVTYERAAIYPTEEQSKARRKGILLLGRLNPSFAVLLGAIYVLVGIALLGAVNAGAGALVDDGTEHGFSGFLATAAGGPSLVLALLLLAALIGYADIKPHPLETRRGVIAGAWAARFLVGGAHALLHLTAIALVVWCALNWDPEPAILVWLAGLAGEFAIGALFGSSLFAFVLWAVHLVRGGKAEQAANEVFAGQALTDCKNLLRMRLGRDGRLTVYPLGLDSVWKRWRYVPDEEDRPHFTPDGGVPAVRLIDEPLEFGP